MKLLYPRISLALLLAALIGFAGVLLNIDWNQKSIYVGGVERTYLFYQPDGIEKESPLLLVFHGFSGNAERIRRSSQLHELVNKHKFYLAYLNGDPTWLQPSLGKPCADVEFFDELVEDLERKYLVDSERIYVAGMSMGGDFVIRLGGLRSDRIAAVVSQGMITDTAVVADTPFPLMVIVGTDDDRVPDHLFPVVPNAFRERGHQVEVIRPEGIGHWWHVPLNEELWSFLSRHRLR